MHPLVRDLYKRFMVVARDYPTGIDHVRQHVKSAFFRNASLTSQDDILRAVNRGRYMVRELIGVIQLKKYRTLRKRYGKDEDVEMNENEMWSRVEQQIKQDEKEKRITS